MVFVRVSIVILSFLSLETCIGQNGSSILKRVQENNLSFKDFRDSTLLVKQRVINRLTQDTSDIVGLFQFIDKPNYEFNWFRQNKHRYWFSNDSVALINAEERLYKKVSLKPYDYDDHDAQSWYYSFKQIPTVSKGDFVKSRFGKPNLFVTSDKQPYILQKDKKFDQFRRLYFDTSSYRVIKAQYFNDDYERPDAFVEFEFQYFKYDVADSLMREYGLGKYYNTTPNTTISIKGPNLIDFKDSVFFLQQNVPVKLSKEYILFDYWYLSCSPCLQMMPFLNKLHEEIDTSKVIIIGVNTIDDTDDIIRYKTKRDYFLNEMDMTKMLSLHNLNEHPQLILVDEDLNDIKIFKGYGKGVSDKEIRSYLRGLNLLK